MKKKMLVLTAAFALTGAAANAQMDQIGNDGSVFATAGVSASQWFEEANAGFRIAVIDNFTVDATNNNLQSFAAVVGGWNGFVGQWNDVLGWRVEIYSSPQAAEMDLVGDVASVHYGNQGWSSIDTNFVPGSANFHALVEFDLNSLILNPGEYWIGLTIDHTFTGGGGQVGVGTRASGGVPGDLNAMHANPLGGFGFTLQALNPAADAAYRLVGTAVPAPGALALLGLAGLAARRRRRA